MPIDFRGTVVGLVQYWWLKMCIAVCMNLWHGHLPFRITKCLLRYLPRNTG